MDDRIAPVREKLDSVLERSRSADWVRRLPPAWLALLIVGVIGAIGVFWYFAGSGNKEVEYVTKPVAHGAVLVKVRATGTIQPTDKVEISSELSGILREVLVDFNDLVKKGQILAKLDTETLEAQRDSARAALAVKQARVREVSATVAESSAAFGRANSLHERQFLSDQGLEQVRATHVRALASLGSAQADMRASEGELKIRQTNIGKATIRSPIEGIVLVRNVEAGQTVASSLQAPVLFTLAHDLKRMQLEVDTDEADVSLVKSGNTATFWVEGLPDRTFPAKVTAIHFSPETVAGVVTYKTVLAIDNSELLLRPGMTATADIIVLEIRDTLLVPNAALRFTPQTGNASKQTSWLQRLMPRSQGRRTSQPRKSPGTGKSVWVQVGEAVQQRMVVTGASDGVNTSIAEGELRAGELVVVDSTASE